MKSKNFLIASVFILFFVLFSCEKRQKNVDKTNILSVLEKIENQKIKSRDKTLDSLYAILIQNKNDSINRNLLIKISDYYYYDNKLEKYLKIIKKVNKLAIIEKDTIHIAKTYHYIGDYYDEKADLDSAFNYYYKSEKLYHKLKDTINTSKLRLKKAGILYDNGSFNECETTLIEVLKLLDKKRNEELIFECYNVLALDLTELKNYNKALKYFSLAKNQLNKIESTDKLSKIFSLSTNNNNIGNVYLRKENYKKAQQYYLKGLNVKDLKKINPSLYAMLLSNYAYAKMKNHEMFGVRDMLFESFQIRDSLKSDAGIISSKYKIGEYYFIQKDTAKAIENLIDCYKVSKKANSCPDVLKSLKLLTEIDKKNKNHFADEYFRVNDSLQLAERLTRNKFARIEFETENIEKENKVLIKKNTYILISSILLCFFLGSFLIVYRLKSKNKELKLIQEQQNKNEEIYQLLLKQQSISEESRKEERNRIAMELHDGIVNRVFTTRFNLMQLQSNETIRKDELIKELEKTESEVRRVSHELNLNLEANDNSIANMLKSLIETQKNEWNTNFNITIDKFIDWNKIDIETQMNIYRIIQEAIQNINKYSQAKKCIVIILKTEDKTTIRIWDNGIGFDTTKKKKGIGLKNILERVKSINGTLKIKSKINKGTTIEIIF